MSVIHYYPDYCLLAVFFMHMAEVRPQEVELL